MKKIIASVFALAVLYGCGPSKADLEAKARQGFIWDYQVGAFVQDTTVARDEVTGEVHDDIETRVIDGCEYLVLKVRCGSCNTSDNAGIVHKGNCKNPVHNPNPDQ